MTFIIAGTVKHQAALHKITEAITVKGVMDEDDAALIAEQVPTAIMDCTEEGELIFTSQLRQSIKLATFAYILGKDNN